MSARSSSSCAASASDSGSRSDAPTNEAPGAPEPRWHAPADTTVSSSTPSRLTPSLHRAGGMAGRPTPLSDTIAQTRVAPLWSSADGLGDGNLPDTMAGYPLRSVVLRPTVRGSARYDSSGTR